MPDHTFGTIIMARKMAAATPISRNCTLSDSTIKRFNLSLSERLYELLSALNRGNSPLRSPCRTRLVSWAIECLPARRKA